MLVSKNLYIICKY